MKINTKIRYGLRTMIEIADCQSPEGILQKEIAKRQQISVKYLDYIVSALKLKGLIRNVGGRGSGYVLARSPVEITMLDIYTAFESVLVVQCVSDESFCETVSQTVCGNAFRKKSGTNHAGNERRLCTVHVVFLWVNSYQNYSIYSQFLSGTIFIQG